MILKGAMSILVLHGAAVAWLGSSGVSVRTRLQFTNMSQNDPNGEEGCGKAHPLPCTPLVPGKTEEAEITPSWYCFQFVEFENPAQKLVKLITQDSVKIKVKAPAPHIPLSLLHELHRFSVVLSSFPVLFFVE